MLFVANIGSTMAKMFAFVFSRITMIFFCRMSNKKKRALALKNRQKLIEKNNQAILIVNEKLPISTEQIKSNLKPLKDDSISSKQTEPSNSLSMTSSTTDIRQLPADIRLNMLTGAVSNTSTSRSLTSSINSVEEKSKDAIIRINELIRQNSIQNIDEITNEEPHRRKSFDISPIQYYINETNKLTTNLDNSLQDKTIEKNENHMKQVEIIQPEVISKPSKDVNKKNLKRSKSESRHNRRLTKKTAIDTPSINDNQSIKPARRRFFSRKNGKLKTEKSSTSPDEVRQINEKLPQKSQSFNEHSPRILSPPPDYEKSTINQITPLPLP